MNLLKLDWGKWLYGLVGGFITGGSSALSAWLGMTAAKMSGLDVPTLNWNALGIIFLCSGLAGAVAYLKQSPLPPEDKDDSSSPGPGPSLGVKVGLFAALLGIVFAPGCATKLAPEGVYKGDVLLYQADTVIPLSYGVLSRFVTWEQENRTALAVWPEVRKSADHVRANARNWIGTAIALRDAYAAAPSAENGDALQKALAVLQTAMVESTKYLSLYGNSSNNGGS